MSCGAKPIYIVRPKILSRFFCSTKKEYKNKHSKAHSDKAYKISQTPVIIGSSRFIGGIPFIGFWACLCVMSVTGWRIPHIKGVFLIHFSI